MAAKAKAVDWGSVEIAYRAGIRTLTDIGKEHGISHVAILKRAKAEGWSRDLRAKIQAKADEKVTRALVTGKVTGTLSVTEKQAIEVESGQQATVRLEHRKDIAVLKRTIVEMAEELNAESNRDLQDALELVLEEKIENLGNQQAKTALYKAFNAAMALGSRAGAGRNLVTALATLIDKERQAFGIDKEGNDRKSIGEWLDAL